MDVKITLTDAQAIALERHRKFLNRTRGTQYADVSELCTFLLGHFMNRVVDEVVQRRANKVHAAFKRLTPAQQTAMMQQLSVTDDDDS
jgi:hypothetical protein